MSEQRMVCCHCGGDKFHAEVTITGSAWVDSVGVFLSEEGKPRFEQDGGPRDIDTFMGDVDFDTYVCSTCERKSGSLGTLVIGAPGPDAEPISPCGRCEHSRHRHAPRGTGYDKKLYTRPALPCDEEGCRCHDFL